MAKVIFTNNVNAVLFSYKKKDDPKQGVFVCVDLLSDVYIYLVILIERFLVL